MSAKQQNTLPHQMRYRSYIYPQMSRIRSRNRKSIFPETAPQCIAVRLHLHGLRNRYCWFLLRAVYILQRTKCSFFPRPKGAKNMVQFLSPKRKHLSTGFVAFAITIRQARRHNAVKRPSVGRGRWVWPKTCCSPGTPTRDLLAGSGEAN